MGGGDIEITALLTEEIRQDALPHLCELIQDAVAGGASVGWLAVPTQEDAEAYWTGVARSVERGEVIVLVASRDARIVGTVQLHLSSRANGAHRAEVARLLVHSRARRHGIGAALMRATEAAAIGRGISLLVLDTRTADPAERLYEREGYTLAGVIPDYARGTDGRLAPTSIMYKQL